MSICSECDRKTVARGLCARHYSKAKSAGQFTDIREKRSRGADFEPWFWSQADKSNGEDSCWPWLKFREPSGYGSLGSGKKTAAGNHQPVRAHRVAFELAFGYTPDTVRHICDNPPCVNPIHLEDGSQRDNMNDRITHDSDYWKDVRIALLDK